MAFCEVLTPTKRKENEKKRKEMCDKMCNSYLNCIYRQASNIRRTFASNKFADHSDAVGALPVGAAPTASSFSTYTWHQ